MSASIEDGDDITGLWGRKLAHSAPGSYTIYKEDSTIYGVANTKGYSDYSDSDAHTVFQAVADALSSGGQIAIKGPATYDMQEDWELTYSTAAPLKVIGVGGILTTKLDYNKSGGTACIRPKNAADNFWLELENLHIDGYTAPDKTGVLLDASSMCRLNRVRVTGFQNAGGKGIQIHDGYYNTLLDCFVSYCRSGIQLGPDSGTPMANANQIIGGFVQNFSWSDGIGIFVHGNTNKIIGTTIETFQHATAEGIKVSGASGDLSQDNTIIGCHIESSGGPIGIHMTTYTYRTLAIGCKDSLSGAGLDFWKDDNSGSSANTKISGNTVTSGEMGINIGRDNGAPTTTVKLLNWSDYLYLNNATGFHPGLNNASLGHTTYPWEQAFIDKTLDLKTTGIIKDPKNLAGTAGGTPVLVEIDLGGSAYWINAYPTYS